MKYVVISYNERPDGRIEPKHTERLELTHEQAVALSHTAIVLSMADMKTYIHQGKHAQFDNSRLGWL